MHMNTRKILACLSAFTMLSMTGCSLEEFFNGETKQSSSASDIGQVSSAMNVAEHGIAADTPYKTIGDEEGVLFETALNEEDIAENKEVGLYDEAKNKLADLYDDGTNGDQVAGDGIYSCRYVPDVAEETQREYSIRIGDYETEPVPVRYFDPVTEEDVSAAQNTQESFKQATSKFADAQGNIPEEKKDEALKEVENLVEQMQMNGEVIEYRVNEHQNVVAKLSSGITCVYSVPEDGYDQASAVTDLTVTTCQPCKAGYSSSVSKNMSYPDEGAQFIADEFDNVSFTQNLDDGSVTRSTVSSFGPDQIILWHGHGGYDPKLHSFIVLGEKLAAGASSSTDFVEDALVVWNDGTIAFTYRYVQAYCGDMSNTLLYLGCCKSGYDGVLASTFLSKNCNVVIANSNTILTAYNTAMIRSFAKNLAQEKTILWLFKTGHRTAAEALAAAKSSIGKNDGSKNKATPLIFGNSSYMIEEAAEEELESGTERYTEALGSLKLSSTFVTVKAGESASISILEYPEGYSASNFSWTIENTSVATVSGGTITGVSAGTTILEVKSTDGNYQQYCAVSVS